MPKPTYDVKFVPSGRGKAQCPADPNFPYGVEIDGRREGLPFCTFALDYPAPECGVWLINCHGCHCTYAVTAAGRADDPVSITIPCPPQAPQPSVPTMRAAKARD
jgi:hypothetical protein